MADALALHPHGEGERSHREYEIIAAAFARLLDCWENGAQRWEVIEDIVTNRTAFLVQRVIDGLSIDFETALSLLRNHNGHTTDRERQQREILIAAIDNLVDFAAAQQWSMIGELPEHLDEQSSQEYEDVCRRYNLSWSARENDDVLYCSLMAAWWIGIAADTPITYMTQGDERVRPWHEELEGITYPKSSFPAELIPPIEYGCRCYLVAEGMGAIVGSAARGLHSTPAVHPVFRESLCTGGRIFSPGHPYFRAELPSPFKAIVRHIKAKLYL